MSHLLLPLRYARSAKIRRNALVMWGTQLVYDNMPTVVLGERSDGMLCIAQFYDNAGHVLYRHPETQLGMVRRP